MFIVLSDDFCGIVSWWNGPLDKGFSYKRFFYTVFFISGVCAELVTTVGAGVTGVSASVPSEMVIVLGLVPNKRS